METISTATVLERGAMYLGNHPDNLVRRTVLAQILVDSRAVKSIEAGLLAFKLWAVPQSREHTIETILSVANERAKNASNLLHQ
jgi:hypothetical protein